MSSFSCVLKVLFKPSQAYKKRCSSKKGKAFGDHVYCVKWQKTDVPDPRYTEAHAQGINVDGLEMRNTTQVGCW